MQPITSTIHAIAPRIAQISLQLAVSFGLHKGANKAVIASDGNFHPLRQIINDFRFQATLATVIQFCNLFDITKRTISFRRVYNELGKNGVVEALVAEKLSSVPSFLRAEEETTIRKYIASFLSIFESITDPKNDAYVRLKHFRDMKVAHYSEHELSKYIVYNELEILVGKALEMATAMSCFTEAPNLYQSEIAGEHAEDAEKFMLAGLKFGDEENLN